MLLLSTLVFALQAQDKGGPAADKPAAPPVDRSAEPALKSFFVKSGAVKGVHIKIGVFPREVEADRYNDDSTMELWVGDGGRFRFVTSNNYWGGGSLFVSDGLSLLTDDMSDDGSIRISNPKKNLFELNDQEPILYLLQGEAGFDALVDKDKSLKFVTKPDDKDQVIEVNTKKLGKILLRYPAGAVLPSSIGMMTAPWWQDQKDATDKPYTFETVKVVSQGAIDSTLFRVAAPKGKKVLDERKKG